MENCTIASDKVKASLIAGFGTEEAMGVEYTQDGEAFISHKGLKVAFGHCTSVARYIADVLGRADCEVRGFMADDNTDAELSSALMSGHDFVVYKGKYIIDPWVSLFSGFTEKVVWEIGDDETELFYGPEKNWALLSKRWGASNVRQV